MRSHTKRDRFLDVCTFTPIGDCLFLATDVPTARISSSDILTTFPFQYSTPNQNQLPNVTSSTSCDTLINSDDEHESSVTFDMLELPREAFNEFLELCETAQKKNEKLWVAGAGETRKSKSKPLKFW